MKRFWLCLMLLLLLAGCAEKERTVATVTPTLEAQSVAAEGPKTVSNVDELLAAIETGAQIILKPGSYDLTAAADYGMETENPWYFWEHNGDGYGLVLTAVQDLTIRAPEGAQLVTGPRYADVLTLDSCRNVVLEGFAAGHTDGAECAGGVIHLRDCEKAALQELRLYGCGIVGLTADGCTDVTMDHCEIYDCTYAGVYASITDGLDIKNCTFHDLGDIYQGNGQVFYLYRCKDVSVTDCQVSENNVVWLVYAQPGAGIELRDTAFTQNRVEGAALGGMCSGLVMDGCTFTDNRIHRWLESDETTILDGIGKTWTEESLNVWYNPSASDSPAGDRTEVTVSTVDELIAAIAPDTEIVLADGVYDLSTAEGYGSASNDYYFWAEEFDGPGLVLTGVNNLVIRSESGDVTKCTLSAVPRYANVLSLRNCSDVTLQGFTAGHTVEPGYCTGGVLDFQGCDAVAVENCGLYGCGILGVRADLCRDVAVKNCDIYECSYGGIQMGQVNGVNIENCKFRDLGGDSLYFYDCANVTVDGNSISGNARIP